MGFHVKRKKPDKSLFQEASKHLSTAKDSKGKSIIQNIF